MFVDGFLRHSNAVIALPILDHLHALECLNDIFLCDSA